MGTPVLVDGPHGSFSCDLQPADAFLFVAGGIGISPILSMLRTLADRRDARRARLLYACSRWDRAAFRTELEALESRLDLQTVYVLEAGHEGWRGATGYVTRELVEPLLGAVGAGSRVFLCGPDPMMMVVKRILLDCGVPRRRVSMERFHLG